MLLTIFIKCEVDVMYFIFIFISPSVPRFSGQLKGLVYMHVYNPLLHNFPADILKTQNSFGQQNKLRHLSNQKCRPAL